MFSGKALFVIGGACNVNMTDAINKVEYYDPGSFLCLYSFTLSFLSLYPSLSPYPSLSLHPLSLSLSLYASVSKLSHIVNLQSLGSDKWFEAAPLNKCRSLVGVSVLSGTLWAVRVLIA